MGGVAVVTDSTADLPPDLAEILGLRVVPMSVSFGDETFISRITISDDEFYDRLKHADTLPTTSQPTPAWFEEAYGDAYDDGADAVVSVHVSAQLSGTCELARTIAAKAPLPVHVVDSRQVSGGLSLVVLAAQEAAADGASAAAVVAAAEHAREHVSTFVVVDTLEYLKKGGRLSGAQALLGSMLRVRPILWLNDGRVEVRERTRTWRRAIDRMLALVEEHVAGRPAHVAVTHALAEGRTTAVWEQLEQRVDLRERLDAVVGPVVGTHTGPGAVGVSVLPLDDAEATPETLLA